MSIVHRSSHPDIIDTEVFYDETFGVWSSPNVTTLRYPVPVYDMEIGSNIRVSDFRQPRWLSNTYPYVAFWPKTVEFTGPLFSRLNICDRTLLVVKDGPIYYTLHSDIIASWSRLEHALADLGLFLVGKGMGRKAELGLLPLPRDCGYMSRHKEPKFVRHCAYKSREAFIGLGAFCSFAIANLLDKQDHVREEPLWVRECRTKGVHAQWLEDLQQSFVCNFAPGFRAGAYVNGYLSTWAKQFPAFKAANVPLLIWWGHTPNTVRDQNHMKAYLPRLPEVEMAKSLHQARSIPQPPTLAQDFDYGHHDHEPQDPFSAGMPSPGEGIPSEPMHQRDEALQNFLIKLREEEEEYAAQEDPEDSLLRIEAETQAEVERQDVHLEEPTVGSAMFEWVRLPGEQLARQYVPRLEWKMRWSLSTPATRWFHGYLDQWTVEVDRARLNDDFDPNSSTAFDSSDVVGTAVRPAQRPTDPVPRQAASVLGNVQSSTVIQPRTLDLRTGGLEVYAADVVNVYGDLVPDTKVVSQPLQHVLHYRYGFCAQVPYTTDERMKNYKSAAGECKGLVPAMSRIGLKEFRGDELEQAVVDLYNFVVGNGTVPVAFSPLWDVAPVFQSRIGTHPLFRYHKLHEQAHIIGLNDSDLHRQWYLVLIPDGCTVLQVFRDNHPGVLAIVRSLLLWGIPFNTVRCVNKKPDTSRRMGEKRIGLGYRPRYHRFDRQEYAAYEEKKRDILLSGHGRAARMAGGILWRLSQDVIDVRSVTRGPALSVSTEGLVIDNMGDYFLVDDKLSANEEEIICGVYRIDQNKNQEAHLSWWPKQIIWQKGGLNVGYWSVDCEAWYQRRLSEIRSGKAELYSSHEWREKLKYRVTNTKQFTDNMNTLGNMVLDGRHSYWRG